MTEQHTYAVTREQARDGEREEKKSPLPSAAASVRGGGRVRQQPCAVASVCSGERAGAAATVHGGDRAWRRAGAAAGCTVLCLQVAVLLMSVITELLYFTHGIIHKSLVVVIHIVFTKLLTTVGLVDTVQFSGNYERDDVGSLARPYQ